MDALESPSLAQRSLWAVRDNPELTNIQIAKLTGIEKSSISRARKLINGGPADILESIGRGEITLYAATEKAWPGSLQPKPKDPHRERPDIENRMDRALDQLENAVDTIDQFLSERGAVSNPNRKAWANRLAGVTASVATLFNVTFTKNGAAHD